MFFNSNTIPEIRAETIMDGMGYMRYDAVNVGEGELDLGISFFLDKMAQHSLQMVSANLKILKGDHTNVLQPYIIKDVNGVKIGITGITPAIMIKGNIQKDSRFKIENALDALKKILPELDKKTDLIILLSHFRFSGTLDFLTSNDLPEVDIVIAGHGRKITKAPEKIKEALIVQNSVGGQYLGVLDVTLNEGQIQAFSLENIALTDEVAIDQHMAEKIKKFKSVEGNSRPEE